MTSQHHERLRGSHFEWQQRFSVYIPYVSHGQELLCCWVFQLLFQRLWAEVLPFSNQSRAKAEMGHSCRKNWTPNEHSWICNAHFVRGMKSDDPTCPDYVPSLFRHIDSPKKKRAERSMIQYKKERHHKETY